MRRANKSSILFGFLLIISKILFYKKMSGAATGASQILKTVTKTLNRRLVLGTCQPSEIPQSQLIAVKHLDFDEYLKMYFTKWMNYYAFDPIPGGCKQGDIVLVEELDKKMTRDITHKILRIVYPLGDMIDPVTGKRTVRTMYREDKERINKLWGENPDLKFDYYKAPRRGWQEGKKDWTHKKPFRKFHEFTDRDQTEAEW